MCNAYKEEDVGEGVVVVVVVSVDVGDAIEVVLFLRVMEVLGCQGEKQIRGCAHGGPQMTA